jgi:hypothetical protein
MRAKDKPADYVIVSHRGRAGVRLWKPGSWVNEQFINDPAAEAFAAKDAGGRPFTIERRHVTKRLTEILP